jgi:Tfp pilus assembly protein PilV
LARAKHDGSFHPTHFCEETVFPMLPPISQPSLGGSFRRRAFSLVEVVIALGLFTFAIMGIVGLFAVGINAGKESGEQVQAANLASLLISTRRALPTKVITNFALPPLNVAYSSNGLSVMGVASDGTTTAPADYNLYYQAGTNAVTGPHLAQVHLMLWWPATLSNPPVNPANRYELTTQVALP